MRRRQLILAGLSLSALLAIVGCVPSTPLPDLGGREVKVATTGDYPPFSFIDPGTGQAAGWDYEMVGELGRRLNFKPVLITVPFSEIIDGVAAGTYDMAASGVTITYLRGQKVQFSNQYMIVRQRLVVRLGDARFATLVATKETPTLKVGALASSTNYDAAVGYFGESRVQSYPDFDPLVTALLSGELDVAVMDDVAYHAQQGLHPNELGHVPGVLYGDLLGFPMTPGSDLVGAVNAALAAMDQDGTLQALNDKWIPAVE